MSRKKTTYSKKKYTKLQSEGVIPEALSKLDNIIGLTKVKEIISRDILLNFIEQERYPHFKVIAGLYMFKGNPGTGKTTVARILGEILKELKILPKGHFIEATRVDLVGGYVGETAIKTQKMIDRAIGGVLFIDNAYSLLRGGDNDFGKEAIDTIFSFMMNNRDKFSLILAGYNEDMDRFLDAKIGLQSRLTNTIIFEDYTEDELIQIFKIFAKGYTISNEIEERLRVMFTSMKSNSNFSNGRDARNLFNAIKTKMNRRLNEIGNLEIKDPRLYIIEMDDLPNDASL